MAFWWVNHKETCRQDTEGGSVGDHQCPDASEGERLGYQTEQLASGKKVEAVTLV